MILYQICVFGADLDLPMIDAQFRFNRCNSFREEYISVFSPYGPVLIL
jgi:hypothetical protein